MHTTEGEIAKKARLDGVRQVRDEFAIKWGAGQLRLIVGDEMRIRFDRQSIRFKDALAMNDMAQIETQGEAMKRAYHALDAEAHRLGRIPPPESVWTVVHPRSGETIWVAETDADARRIAMKGRVTFSLREIATFIPGGVLEIRKQIPMSEVLPEVDFDDPIPF